MLYVQMMKLFQGRKNRYRCGNVSLPFVVVVFDLANWFNQIFNTYMA